MDVLTALRRTLELVKSSQNSAYAPDTAAEIARALQKAVSALETGGRIDKGALGKLFLPTGSIQETAHTSGWGDEYLVLADAMDAFLEAR